jgi:hypothetical protein
MIRSSLDQIFGGIEFLGRQSSVNDIAVKALQAMSKTAQFDVEG